MSENFQRQAAGKLDGALKSGKYGKRATNWSEVCRDKKVAEGVHDALQEFCRQEDEFAQAVVQGGSFEDCMKTVAKLIQGGETSDMKAYGAAVRFYFPGAEIRVSMTIDLIGQAGGPTAPEDAPQEDGGPEAYPARTVCDNNPAGHASGSASGRDSLLIDLSDFF